MPASVVVYEGDGKSCTKATGTPEYGADTVAVTMTFDRQCGGLSGGAIAGIVIGSVVVVAAAVATVVAVVWKKRNQRAELASMKIKLENVLVLSRHKPSFLVAPPFFLLSSEDKQVML